MYLSVTSNAISYGNTYIYLSYSLKAYRINTKLEKYNNSEIIFYLIFHGSTQQGILVLRVSWLPVFVLVTQSIPVLTK